MTPHAIALRKSLEKINRRYINGCPKCGRRTILREKIHTEAGFEYEIRCYTCGQANHVQAPSLINTSDIKRKTGIKPPSPDKRKTPTTKTCTVKGCKGTYQNNSRIKHHMCAYHSAKWSKFLSNDRLTVPPFFRNSTNTGWIVNPACGKKKKKPATKAQKTKTLNEK